MNDVSTLTLPVLPLTTGVVFPQMVVTIAVESDEAQAAAEAASDGRTGVDTWAAVWDETYGESDATEHDFDIAGWASSAASISPSSIR